MTPFLRDNLRPLFAEKKILLCVTGSIAAYKTCELVRSIRECGARVRVVLSESAQKFVTKTTLETLSQEPVYTSLWDDEASGTHHIDAARWADLAVIAPATANTISKITLGLADDLLTTEILAFQGPIVVVPAMNPVMYGHPAIQGHLQTLKSRGVYVAGPTSGVTACGEDGPGRMIEPDEILEAIAEKLIVRTAQPKRYLITLGPTQSALDPVRYLTNRSSGKMGAALAWAAWARGMEVIAVRGSSSVALPRSIKTIDTVTANQMAEAVFDLWPQCDVFVAAAAVLDWDIQNPSREKLKKTSGKPTLEFVKNTDILATVAHRKSPSQFVLGFAAETEDPIQNGRTKLQTKGCDAVFANDVSNPSHGFESEQNAGWWITQSSIDELAPASKPALARKLVELIERPSIKGEHALLN